METPFVLAHHRPDGYHRCVRVAGLHLCARCLGLYPVMFGVIGGQIALRSPKVWEFDPLVAFGLVLPALVDWARGRLDPTTGTNTSRVVTGVLLGMALGRTLYLHLRQPFHPLAVAQFGGLIAVFVLVEAVAYLRRRRSDRNQGPDVPSRDRSGTEP